MRVVSVKKSSSPLWPDCCRVVASLRFDNGDEKDLWFDVPADFQGALSERGEPWLVLSLPTAMVRGENVVTDLPVDSHLLHNLTALQRVWLRWYPALKAVRMEAPIVEGAPAGSETMLFFSGGVDSYFSLIGPPPEAAEGLLDRVSDLVMVWGFDIPLRLPEEFQLAREANERAARHFGKRLIPVASNLLEMDGYQLRPWWGPIGHGAALAGIGHLLANRFREAVIGSTHDLAHLSPWGSHPLTDPLFSSRHTRIIHDGACFTRVEKIARLCDVPVAARDLRVCFTTKGSTNCSACSKCLRTMVTFDLLGQKEVARSFSWAGYSLERVGRVFLRNQNEVDFFLEIRQIAVKRGRQDIVEAIDASLARSRRWRLVDTALRKGPLLWRFDAPLRRWLIG